MKGFLAILTVLLLPLSVWAMTPLADDELSEVSGQSGVSIMPNVTMDIHFDVIAWGDSDGIGGSTSGGYVGVTNLSVNNLSIGPRTDDYSELWPSTTKTVNGVPYLVYDTSIDLNILRNPLAPRNLK
jgi:hypothetical protein